MTDDRRHDRDWRQQLATGLRRPEDLDVALLSSGGFDAQASARFPMFSTPYYASLARSGGVDDPIMKMIVPQKEELEQSPNLKFDPIDEQEHSPVPGLIRRYPDRAVLLVSSSCAVHCRHCTRRHIGEGNLAPVSGESLDDAISYLREHEEIREVILSGGDPLLLEDGALDAILTQLREVKSIELLRIGTRVPVALPMRIDERLASLLERHHPLYINTHFNHPWEITQEAARAATLLAKAGIPLGNQTVLLRGVNDASSIIEELCRALLRIRIRPYYLFMCDLWHGIEHLRVPLEKGIEIMTHLRSHLSGIGIPKLVIDLPGGHGKVPVSPDYIVSHSNGRFMFRAPNGKLVEYCDPR